jgi:hypothetical protein
MKEDSSLFGNELNYANAIIIIIIIPFSVLCKSKTIVGRPDPWWPEQGYVYLQKEVAKFVPWDTEGLALINKRKSKQVYIVVPLLFPYFPYFPYFIGFIFLSPFEVPFSSADPSFLKEA